MNTPSSLRRLLGALLTVLGWPVWQLYRILGLPRAAPPAPEPPAHTADPPHLTLPADWTRPREMAEVKPTLAPVTLAFGLAALALGVLVGSATVMILGGLLSLIGAGMWAWDAWQETA